MGKILGVSTPNKIDVIWAMAKDQRNKKGKNNGNAKGSRCRRKDKKTKD